HALLADAEVVVAARGARIDHANFLQVHAVQDITALDGRGLAGHGVGAGQVAHEARRVVGRPALGLAFLGRLLAGAHRDRRDRARLLARGRAAGERQAAGEPGDATADGPHRTILVSR